MAAVVLLLSATAARGADISDADSTMAARIELLREENAQIKRRLEKVRGAISYWGELGFTPDRGGVLGRGRGPRGIGRASIARPAPWALRLPGTCVSLLCRVPRVADFWCQKAGFSRHQSYSVMTGTQGVCYVDAVGDWSLSATASITWTNYGCSSYGVCRCISNLVCELSGTPSCWTLSGTASGSPTANDDWINWWASFTPLSSVTKVSATHAAWSGTWMTSTATQAQHIVNMMQSATAGDNYYVSNVNGDSYWSFGGGDIDCGSSRSISFASSSQGVHCSCDNTFLAMPGHSYPFVLGQCSYPGGSATFCVWA